MKTLEFRDGALWLLDQTQLPGSTVALECRDHLQVAAAIRSLSVRGAPAIGLAAAYGTVLAARSLASAGFAGPEFRARLEQAMEQLRVTRPTAVNLAWALDRMRRSIDQSDTASPGELNEMMLAEAHRMLEEDERANRRMGRFGAELVPDRANVLTHCNTGALATGAFGTAFGVIRTAHEQGKHLHVWVDETRPLLQGARLTAWELKEAGIPFTLITDNMAGHFMARGRVDLVMLGADRIASNGDTANKIGTYSLAVLAAAHQLPFYVVAPTSTVDLSLSGGDEIRIEERRPEEVTTFGGTSAAPPGTAALNPAFDVTPAALITAIVTEAGVIRPPFGVRLAEAVRGGERATVSAVKSAQKASR